MKVYRKLIRPVHCYPGQGYEPKTELVEKEEKWYPEEEREHLEGKYGYLNEGHFSDLIFEEKYEPCLLKELEEVEKNKECHEDKIAVECLNAIQTVNKYIDEEADECGCTYWKDKKGYAFQADTGYFFEGLDNFEAYLIKRLRKAGEVK